MTLLKKNPAQLVANQNSSDYSKINQECIKLLKQCLSKTRSKYAKGGSVGSLMDNGRIDQPMKPLSMRTLLSTGGKVDDE